MGRTIRSCARRRELQIAMAMASASGPLNAQAMQRFTRRLELEMATVQLNKTAVGFSHGADTFGWRFYPRVQTRPTRGGLAALGETVCGPSSDADLAQRQLEPGQRECVAIVVMPAFVPWITLDVRTNWFSLTHPKATDPGMTSHLQVPVARGVGQTPCTLAFDSACTIGLSFTVTKTASTKAESAKVDEFFSSTCDTIEITVPDSFMPPTKASLRLLARDAASGETAATFSFDDPAFDARRSRYAIAGSQLRNFIGDTSRPDADKTLRGALKPYLDALLLRGDRGDDVPFLVTAELVSGEQAVPVGGELAVRMVRRGKTTTEPAMLDATTP